jgi:hypothetical protein
MKKFIISLMLLLIFSFVGLYSTCPPGYQSGTDCTFTPEGWVGCTLTVHWCYIPADPINHISADIFISGFEIQGTCTYLVQYAPGLTPPIPEDFLGGLAENSAQFRSVMGLPDIVNLTVCGEVWMNNPDDYGMQCRVFFGACYNKVLPEEPLHEIWQICDPGYWGQCKEYYRFCKQYINGHWVRTVYCSGGQPPQFQCSSPCVPKCQ